MIAARVPRVLYLTQHGLASPLGRAQCLPYLLRLARSGRVRFRVISFESDPLPDAELRRTVREAGIEWVALRYHRTIGGVGTLFDVVWGLARALALIARERVDLVHARSYVMAAIALVLRRALGLPFVFDMLGMLADEYVDIGHWRRAGYRYRATKGLERTLLREAATVIVLTERSATYLRDTGLAPAGVRVEVIPCCVDTARFACDRSRRSGAPPTLVYAGGLGGWYPVDEMLALWAVARRVTPDARFRILTRSDPALVGRAAARLGVSLDRVDVRAATPDAMSAEYCSSDIGLCLIAPMFSKHAASPNKFAEYLASGLPVIANRGVGDLDRILDEARIGVALAAFDERSYEAAWRTVLDQLREDEAGTRARCREVAERDLSAERAVEAYASIYAAIAGRLR